MAKREPVMLAHKYDPTKHNVVGWLMSEKLDGMRAIWDGGITRGLLCSEIPFANIEKHGRYRNEIYATGLWTRYYQPIQAPDWFLHNLPPYGLDGELWMGYGKFQETLSIVKSLTPGPGWGRIKYYPFDMPLMSVMLADGEINIPNFRKEFSGCDQWFLDRIVDPKRPHIFDFKDVANFLTFPQYTIMSVEHLNLFLEEVVSRGGEGVMIRNPHSVWRPERSWNLLKYKPFDDAEGIVVGYVFGRETDRGSKLLGLMGAMVVSWNGRIFELSGFTDEERRLSPDYAFEYGKINPGKEVPSDMTNIRFPRGSKVTFRYRGLSNDGVPREARYWRKFG